MVPDSSFPEAPGDYLSGLLSLGLTVIPPLLSWGTLGTLFSAILLASPDLFTTATLGSGWQVGWRLHGAEPWALADLSLHPVLSALHLRVLRTSAPSLCLTKATLRFMFHSKESPKYFSKQVFSPDKYSPLPKTKTTLSHAAAKQWDTVRSRVGIWKLVGWCNKSDCAREVWIRASLIHQGQPQFLAFLHLRERLTLYYLI